MLNYPAQLPAFPTPTVNLDQLTAWLKVLAEPRRLRIFALLREGSYCNCELVDVLGMPANLISHHLGVLRRARLVDVERDSQDARWLYYSVNRDTLSVLGQQMGFFFDPARLGERQPTCGPRSALILLGE